VSGGGKCPVTVAAVYRGRGASWLVFPASGISHTHCRLKPRDNPTTSGQANKLIDSSLAWSRVPGSIRRYAVTSQRLWSRYDRYFMGIGLTPYNALS